MVKRLSSLLAAIAVVGFAVPAFASAAPEITAGGKRSYAGTNFTATSTNTVVKTSIGNITCETVRGVFYVSLNTGSTVSLLQEFSFLNAWSTCFFKGTTPVTIDDPTLLSLHTGEVGKGNGSLTFEATLPGLTCHYSGSSVPFTYTSGSNALTIKGALAAKPAACGTASIEGNFTLTSEWGAAVLH